VEKKAEIPDECAFTSSYRNKLEQNKIGRSFARSSFSRARDPTFILWPAIEVTTFGIPAADENGVSTWQQGGISRERRSSSEDFQKETRSDSVGPAAGKKQCAT
jgi:hypothetical protein